MEISKDPQGVNDLAEGAELMSLVELQKFLADELSDTGSQFGRAFMPLTDGLGLESPKKAQEAAMIEAKSAAPKLPPRLPPHPAVKSPVPLPLEDDEEDEMPPVDPMMRPLPISRVAPEAPAPEHQPEPVIAEPPLPPPVPTPSVFLRFVAATMDVAFILVLWGFAVFITARFTDRTLAEIATPAFMKAAALEYLAITFCYLAFGIGVLDMTFGMWVWGLRVSYNGNFRVLRKAWRVALSVLFLAPIVPALLLAIRVGGRNLLDGLSGSRVYRTA